MRTLTMLRLAAVMGLWGICTQAIGLPECAAGVAASHSEVAVLCATADGAALRKPDGQLYRLPANVTSANVSPDGRHVHYRMTPNDDGTRVVVNDSPFQLATDVALGAFDRSSRYLAYTENQTDVWLLDLARNIPVRRPICSGDGDPAERGRRLSRLIGVFDLPDGESRILWHRRTDSVDCYRVTDPANPRLESADVPENFETAADVARIASRPTPTGKVLERTHVTSRNPSNGVIGTLHTSDGLRRGFQIFAEPVDTETDTRPLKLVVDGNGETVVNVTGHTVCSWDGKTGIPCDDLLLEAPGSHRALAYLESKTIGRSTWHLVRFGRYAGWIPQSSSGKPHLLEQLAMGSQ